MLAGKSTVAMTETRTDGSRLDVESLTDLKELD
jgi:hypothetical protein